MWVAAYLGIMLFYTFLNVAVWRKLFPNYSEWLNTIVMMICVCGFIWLLKKRYKIILFSNITLTGVVLAILCSILFFLLLDKCLDPVFESIFPRSEQDYQKTICNPAFQYGADIIGTCVRYYIGAALSQNELNPLLYHCTLRI